MPIGADRPDAWWPKASIPWFWNGWLGRRLEICCPGEPQEVTPAEPFRQLWIAAAMRTFDDISIETIAARSGQIVNRSLRIPAQGAQLLAVSVPDQHSLALGINGTSLMQMTLFRSDGTVLEQRGPLRVVVAIRCWFAIAVAGHQRWSCVRPHHAVLSGRRNSDLEG